MSPLTPYLIWIKIAAAVAIVGGLWWAWESHEASVYQRGYDTAVTERKAADDAKLAEDRRVVALEAKELREAAHTESVRRSEDKVKYEDRIKTLNARIASGDERLRAPKGSCVPSSPAPGDTAAASGPTIDESPAVVPEVATAILSIAASSAADVRDYNAVVVEYNRIREACTAK